MIDELVNKIMNEDLFSAKRDREHHAALAMHDRYN